MKQVVSIGLVLVMSLQCFYKLGVITYFTLNREYISKELCVNKEKPTAGCHGQCFLKTNLNLTEETDPGESALPGTTQTVDFPVFLVSQISYTFGEGTQPCEWNSQYLAGFSLQHSTPLFRPPDFPG